MKNNYMNRSVFTCVNCLNLLILNVTFKQQNSSTLCVLGAKTVDKPWPAKLKLILGLNKSQLHSKRRINKIN